MGRLAEAVEPMRAVLNRDVQKADWKNAAISASNLSELELTLGDVDGAVRDAEQPVDFADRSGDAFERMVDRTVLAAALHQAGRRDEALKCFREAEEMQAARQPGYPLLYSGQGFQYCDLLLAEAERAAWLAGGGAAVEGGEKSRQDAGAPSELVEVEKRAATALQIVMSGSRNLLDISLNHLTLGRAGLCRAILEGLDLVGPQSEIEQAVDGLRSAGQLQLVPLGLLTRAWMRVLTDDPDGARADLQEAWEIAQRGTMVLFQADVLLVRARLFRDWEALVGARRLIDEHGYGRRLGELEDAEVAAERW